mmetsp:Transcript_22349/g.63406  ORF Transcript_22349/g.63406 Transcript_22349/m.63406 type:complete len:372 (+) Transcript_22349:848-1963(+)
MAGQMSVRSTDFSWMQLRWMAIVRTFSRIFHNKPHPTVTCVFSTGKCGGDSTPLQMAVRRTRSLSSGVRLRRSASPRSTTLSSRAWCRGGRRSCCAAAGGSSSTSCGRCGSGSSGSSRSWASRRSPAGPPPARRSASAPRRSGGSCSWRPRWTARARAAATAGRRAGPGPPSGTRRPWPTGAWRSRAARSAPTASCPGRRGSASRPSWPRSSARSGRRTSPGRSCGPSWPTASATPGAPSRARPCGTSSCSSGPSQAPRSGSSGARSSSAPRSTATSRCPGAARCPSGPSARRARRARRARAAAGSPPCGPRARPSTPASARTSSLTGRPTASAKVEAAALRALPGRRARSCTSWERSSASTSAPRCRTTG